MASPFLAGLATGAGEAASDYRKSQLGINAEKAKQIMAGLISGDITPATANPTNPVMSAGQSWIGKLMGNQAPQYELGGINRQVKQAGMEQTKALTSAIPSEIALREQQTATGKAIEAGTKASTQKTTQEVASMPLNIQLKQATDQLAMDKANWQRDYDIHKQNMDFEMKQASSRPWYQKWIMGGQVAGGKGTPLNKLQNEETALNNRKILLDQREGLLRQQMNEAIANFSQGQATTNTGTRVFATEDEALSSGYKGDAVINGRPARID